MLHLWRTFEALCDTATNAQCFRPGERFQIQWEESGKQKWVKRFNLLFEDESFEDFKSRIQAALRRRQEVERDARYKGYVEQQQWRNTDTLDKGFQERVMHLAGWTLPQKLPALTQSFLAEVLPACLANSRCHSHRASCCTMFCNVLQMAAARTHASYACWNGLLLLSSLDHWSVHWQTAFHQMPAVVWLASQQEVCCSPR